MSNLYRFEHDKATTVNLNSDIIFLQEVQNRLHKVASMLMRDIEVITNEIVSRQADIEFVPNDSEGNYIEVIK